MKSRRYTILYVDDEEPNLRLFKFAFLKYFDVHLVSSGFEALDFLAHNKVDLIITDQLMPKMSGTDLLRRIAPTYPKMTKMIISGYSVNDALSKDIKELGVRKYIKKPWDRRELREMLEKELTTRESA